MKILNKKSTVSGILLLLFSSFFIVEKVEAQNFPANDSQYEIGFKGVPKNFMQPIISSNYGSTNSSFEIYGRIPVKSKFSVNVATGIGLDSYRKADNGFEGQRGFFLKTGLNKAIGERRTRLLLGLNYIFSYSRIQKEFSQSDDLELWEANVFKVDERKISNALEFEVGYEIALGKSFYIGSSLIVNTGFGDKETALAGYEIPTMPGISGSLIQEYIKMHIVNFSYKFKQKSK